MKSKRNSDSRNRTSIKAVLRSLIITSVMLVLGCMLITTFTISGSIGETTMHNSVIVLIIFAVIVGAIAIKKSAGEGKNIMILAFSLCVALLLLVVNLILFHGDIQSAIPKILAVLAGGVAGGIRLLKKKSVKKMRSR